MGSLIGRTVPAATVAVLLASTVSVLGSRPAVAAPPANDNFPGQSVSSREGSGWVDTSDATAQPGEPSHYCRNNEECLPATRSIWWRFTFPESGLVELNTQNSEVDAVLAAYLPMPPPDGSEPSEPSVDNLLQVKSDDNGASADLKLDYDQIQFRGSKGQSVYLAVDSKKPGRVKLNWTFTAGPDNDTFPGKTLSGPGRQTGTLAGATAETGEPNHLGVSSASPFPYASVWYSYSPSVDEDITVDTEGSEADTVLAVYTGNSVDELTQIASNDDSDGGPTSAVTFPGSAGKTYRIAVDTWGSPEGAPGLVLNLRGSSAATPTTPSAPSAVTATGGAGSAEVSWQEPSGTVTGYQIRVFDPDGNKLGQHDVGAAPTTANMELPPGDYFFKVFSRNGDLLSDTGSKSNTATVSPAATVEPPTDVAVDSVTASTAVVHWRPPATGAGKVLRYDVQARDTSPGAEPDEPVPAAATATELTLTALRSATQYAVVVTAVGEDGAAVASEPSAPFATLASEPPPAPAITAAEPGDATVKLTWEAPAVDPSVAVTEYVVIANPGNIRITGIAPGVRTYTLKNLENGTEYTIELKAQTSAGPTAKSVVKAKPAAAPALPPDPPRHVTAVAAPGGLTVTWSAPTTSGSSAVTSYTVFAGGVAGGASKRVDVAPDAPLTAVITGLTPGDLYAVWVTASSSAGISPSSPATGPVPAG